jgi:hypothetical protein
LGIGLKDDRVDLLLSRINSPKEDLVDKLSQTISNVLAFPMANVRHAPNVHNIHFDDIIEYYLALKIIQQHSRIYLQCHPLVYPHRSYQRMGTTTRRWLAFNYQDPLCFLTPHNVGKSKIVDAVRAFREEVHPRVHQLLMVGSSSPSTSSIVLPMPFIGKLISNGGKSAQSSR